LGSKLKKKVQQVQEEKNPEMKKERQNAVPGQATKPLAMSFPGGATAEPVFIDSRHPGAGRSGDIVPYRHGRIVVLGNEAAPDLGQAPPPASEASPTASRLLT